MRHRGRGADRMKGMAVVSQMLKINPNCVVENMGRGYKYEADAETFRNGLRKAGLPEKSAS